MNKERLEQLRHEHESDNKLEGGSRATEEHGGIAAVEGQEGSSRK